METFPSIWVIVIVMAALHDINCDNNSQFVWRLSAFSSTHAMLYWLCKTLLWLCCTHLSGIKLFPPQSCLIWWWDSLESSVTVSCFRRSCRSEIVWTSFHCLLCLGLSGFFLFWTAILLRYSDRSANSSKFHRDFMQYFQLPSFIISSPFIVKFQKLKFSKFQS